VVFSSDISDQCLAIPVFWELRKEKYRLVQFERQFEPAAVISRLVRNAIHLLQLMLFRIACAS
jgi:hypothetical protein